MEVQRPIGSATMSLWRDSLWEAWPKRESNLAENSASPKDQQAPALDANITFEALCKMKLNVQTFSTPLLGCIKTDFAEKFLFFRVFCHKMISIPFQILWSLRTSAIVWSKFKAIASKFTRGGSLCKLSAIYLGFSNKNDFPTRNFRRFSQNIVTL